MNHQKIARMAGYNADTLLLSAQAECLLLDLAELKQQVEAILRIIGMSPDDPAGGKHRRPDKLPKFRKRNNHRYDVTSQSA
jgi:hypothetical protein